MSENITILKRANLFLASSLIFVMILPGFLNMQEPMGTILQGLLLTIIVALFYFQSPEDQKEYFMFKPVDSRDWPMIIRTAFLLFLAVDVFVVIIEYILPYHFYSFIAEYVFRDMSILAIFLMVVLGGVFEEFIFRSYFFQSYKRVNVYAALIFSSFIFYTFHGFTRIDTFFIGIILGVVLLKTKTVYSVAIIHALYNSFALFLPGLLNLWSLPESFRIIISTVAIYFLIKNTPFYILKEESSTTIPFKYLIKQFALSFPGIIVILMVLFTLFLELSFYYMAFFEPDIMMELFPRNRL